MERPKILIVDDDPDLRRAMKIRLRADHYDTVQASDGHSAIAMAQKEQPSLIILDLGLPAGDGFAVLKRLRDTDTLSGIPVIVLSARCPQFQRTAGAASGGCGFLPEACGRPRATGCDSQDRAKYMAGNNIAVVNDTTGRDGLGIRAYRATPLLHRGSENELTEELA